MKVPTRALSWAAAVLGAPDSKFISAVAAKESNRLDRYPNGVLKGLHEAHIFGELTRHRFSQEKMGEYPVSTDSYKKNRYPSRYSDVQKVFEHASRLDAEAARDASSWGLFQPLGRNSMMCGWDTALAMYQDFDLNPVAQVVGFVNFCISRQIARTVAEKDFEAFAYAYNGSKYAERGYHTKLRAHFAEKQPVGWLVDADPKLKEMSDELKIKPFSKESVLELQQIINRTGFVSKVKEDGVLGPATRRSALICVLSATEKEVRTQDVIEALKAS